MLHNNQNKHKANHCGYKKKPTKKEVNALLDLYAGIERDTYKLTMTMKIEPMPGTQLSLF